MTAADHYIDFAELQRAAAAACPIAELQFAQRNRREHGLCAQCGEFQLPLEVEYIALRRPESRGPTMAWCACRKVCVDCVLLNPVDAAACRFCERSFDEQSTDGDDEPAGAERVELDPVTDGAGTLVGGMRHGTWQVAGYGMYGQSVSRWAHGVLHGRRLYTFDRCMFAIDEWRHGVRHGLTLELAHPLYRREGMPVLQAMYRHEAGELVWSSA